MKKKTPQERYSEKALVTIVVRLNKFTNQDLLEKVKQVKNKQGYIKELIKKDDKIFKTF